MEEILKIRNKIKIVKSKKERNPGIDIIRLIGMYGVIINHILYIHGGANKYPKYSKYLKLLHIATGWHINGFALISGIVGYKSYKYYNLLYLWMNLVFYSFAIYLYFCLFRKKDIITEDISKYFYPIIIRRYWYFTSYFGMYLFLPIINKGIEFLTQNEFKIVVISTISLFVFWKDIKNPTMDVFGFNGGSSLIWLLTYFLTGAYIGKYKKDYFGCKKYIFCAISINCYITSTYIYFKLYLNARYSRNSYIVNIFKQMCTDRYDGVIKVIQSIAITSFFLQIKYNKYVTKILSFLGPLSFGIYLIHENRIVKKHILKYLFLNEPDNISLNSAIILVLLKALKIFIICIVIDYFRLLLFDFLRIRKVCIFLDLIIRKLLKNIPF